MSTDTTAEPVISFVGAGRMGTPMVERLRRAGFPVRVYVRSEEGRERIARSGALVSTDPAHAFADCRICIVCVFSGKQLEQLTLGAEGIISRLPPGAVLVSHVTSTLATTRDLAESARQAGVGFVDAPVSGTPDDIGRGGLTVLTSGADADLRIVRPALASYASTISPLGEIGRATAVKLLNNLIFAAHMQIAEAAGGLAEQAGFSRAELAAILDSCSGDSAAFRYMRCDPRSSLQPAMPFLRKDVRAALDSLSGDDAGFEYLVDTLANGPLDIIIPDEQVRVPSDSGATRGTGRLAATDRTCYRK
ncbi:MULTISPECIES: NAD(P)-dependent oxidoreductase [Nocardia]|uniref:NAD(P)-dependent oxidoreductase n=1 Tax=Nocardia TaxID=1817 RepID=UPI0018E51A52|nr:MULTISPECIES: NAD(P)-dependent oxidoreductase [Nocardia]